MPKVHDVSRIVSLIICLSFVSMGWAETINFGDVSIASGYESQHFDRTFDLTKQDVWLSYSISLAGITEDPPGFGPFVEIGFRESGAENYNPGIYDSNPGGKGGWMLSTIGEIASDDGVFDADDKHNLQASGNISEVVYNVINGEIAGEFGSVTDNTGFLFDRDGPAGSHSLTEAVYDISILYEALSSNSATMTATVNGLDQGFDSARLGLGEVKSSGLSFTGDMTNMELFVGALIATPGSIQVSDITVTTAPIPEPDSCVLGLLALLPIHWIRRRSRSISATRT